MEAFQKHPLYRETVKSKFMLGLTLDKGIWYAIGLFITNFMFQYVPLLPFDGVVYQRIHYALPLAFCIAMANMQHSTGLSMFGYMKKWIAFKRQNRFLHKESRLSKKK